MPPRPPARPGPGAGGDERILRLARELAAVLAEAGLAEIEIADGAMRVRVQRTAPPLAVGAAPAIAAVTASAPAVAPASERPVVTDVAPVGAITLESPMVGTFYRAPSPTADPFVQEGDVVKEGQVLGIIEAMKLMNEIEAKVAGRVAKVLVENGQPVEFGQPLFLIEPQR